MLSEHHVATFTTGFAHGSSNEIQSEWDPGLTYVVQRLQDPGGPSYTSRASFPIDLENQVSQNNT